jgi:ribosomal protein L40E
LAQRYCTNCGAELREDASFCGKCGSPTYKTARVSTPEADVPVSPPPTHDEATATVGIPQDQSEERTEWWQTPIGKVLGVIVAIVTLLAILAYGSGTAVVLVLAIGFLLFGMFLRGSKSESGDPGGTPGKDDAGRLVLRAGYTEPVSDAERSRELEEEIAQYMSEGFFVRQRTATTAQLVRPKKFSFVWALLWLLVFGIGIVVYLIYYAAKQDEGRYVEVDEYGAVKATRQIRHVL